MLKIEKTSGNRREKRQIVYDQKTREIMSVTSSFLQYFLRRTLYTETQNLFYNFLWKSRFNW